MVSIINRDSHMLRSILCPPLKDSQYFPSSGFRALVFTFFEADRDKER